MTTVTRTTLPTPDGEVVLNCYGRPNVPYKIVCIHGWTLDQRSFMHQRELASQHYAIYTYDRRGFGSNNALPSFDDDLRDLSTIVSTLGRGVILFGVSQGARLALRYGAAKPDTLAGMILQGGVVDGLEVPMDAREAIPFEHFSELVQKGLIDQLHSEWLTHPMLIGGLTEPQRAELAELVKNWTGRDLVTPNALPTQIDITEAINNITVPVLLLTGDHETPSRQTHAHYLQRKIHADFVCIPDAGHLVNWSHSAQANVAIAQWLGSHFPWNE